MMLRMRKYLILSLLMLLSAALSAVPAPDVMRTISLQGAYDDVLSVSVVPIAAQTGHYRYGMPFDIQDSSVQNNIYRGRPVANWTCLANTPFRVTVSAEPLKHVTENYSLDYIVTFSYNLAYNIGNAAQNVSGMFEYSTKRGMLTTGGGEFDELDKADKASFMGSVDGTVFFRFEERLETAIDNEAPAGNYEAEVTLTLEALE